MSEPGAGAPALRQAGLRIAISAATDVTKAASSMVMTGPGLVGILDTMRKERIAFQRLLSFRLNILVKKIESVAFLAVGLALSGRAVLTPALVALMFITNGLLSMVLTTDRASPAKAPSRWNMQNVIGVAIAFGLCKLAFSSAALAFGRYRLGLGPGELRTLAFVTLVFGNQTVLFVLRERRPFWFSRPGGWVLAAAAAGVAFATTLAGSGALMAAPSWSLLAGILAAAGAFALVPDQVKRPVTAALGVA